MSFAPTHPDAPNIFPYLIYPDGKAAIAFLETAFGFEKLVAMTDDDGRVAHAELKLGAGILMLGQRKTADDPIPPQTVYVSVSNIDEHCARAKAAGAEITAAPYDTDYGSRDYAAKDLAGHIWYFGTYQPVADAAS